MNANADSLLNKIDELKVLIKSNVYDIISITEVFFFFPKYNGILIMTIRCCVFLVTLFFNIL